MLQNIRWGLRWSLWFATAFSAWVVVLSLARRSVDWPEYGMTTWSIVGGYYLAAGIAGSVVGALRPMTRWRLGTFFLGWIGGTLVYTAIGFLMDGLKDVPWWIGAIPGLAFGGLALVMEDRDQGHTEANWRFIAVVVAIGAVLAVWMKLLGWW